MIDLRHTFYRLGLVVAASIAIGVAAVYAQGPDAPERQTPPDRKEQRPPQQETPQQLLQVPKPAPPRSSPGVMRPPPTGDDMTRPPPNQDIAPTPEIRPPGTPGGDKDVEPR